MDKSEFFSSTPFQNLHNHLSDYSLSFPPNSRWTKQSFKDEADINTIMSRYLSTGELPDVALRAPQYLDATGLDFQDMQNQVIEAQQLFGELPSKIRNRFANDPGEFLAFVSDPSNRSELKSMGLLKEPPAAPNVSPSGGPASDSAPASVTKPEKNA